MEEERLQPPDAVAPATVDPLPLPLRRRWASQDVTSPHPHRPPPDLRKQHVSWDSAAIVTAHEDAPTLPSEEPESPIDSSTPLTGAGTSFSEPNASSALIIPPLPPPPGHNTYVVQMPKDMIYRIPPPENAVFLKRFHQPDHPKKQRCGSITGRCCLCSLLGLFILLVIVGAALGGLYLYLSPKDPEFSIASVSVKHAKDNKTLSYEISLQVVNLNDKLGLSYENGGDVSISYDKVEFAKGSFPSFYQGTKNTSRLNIELAGSIKESGLMPKQVPVWLTFSVDRVPIKRAVWSIYLWNVQTDVRCEFKVSSLTSDIEIVSQNCEIQ